jgi:hypothetical protein
MLNYTPTPKALSPAGFFQQTHTHTRSRILLVWGPACQDIILWKFTNKTVFFCSHKIDHFLLKQFSFFLFFSLRELIFYELLFTLLSFFYFSPWRCFLSSLKFILNPRGLLVVRQCCLEATPSFPSYQAWFSASFGSENSCLAASPHSGRSIISLVAQNLEIKLISNMFHHIVK